MRYLVFICFNISTVGPNYKRRTQRDFFPSKVPSKVMRGCVSTCTYVGYHISTKRAVKQPVTGYQRAQWIHLRQQQHGAL